MLLRFWHATCNYFINHLKTLNYEKQQQKYFGSQYNVKWIIRRLYQLHKITF